MKPSRFTSLIAAAALSVGAFTALLAPGSIAQAQPKETFMCWIGQTAYDPGSKVDFADGQSLCAKKMGTEEHRTQQERTTGWVRPVAWRRCRCY